MYRKILKNENGQFEANVSERKADMIIKKKHYILPNVKTWLEY